VQGDELTIYTLSKEDGQLGWYLFSKDSQIPAGKCYLLIENGEIPDAIFGVVKSQSARSARYNLSGQRVDDSYKGVVIMNGKKYLVK